jgi:hydroxymethylglutaryl-CoA reductase
VISIIGNIYWQTKTSCITYCHSDRSTIEACVHIKEEIIKLLEKVTNIKDCQGKQQSSKRKKLQQTTEKAKPQDMNNLWPS